MDEQQVLDPTPISDDLVPKKPTTYDMLMRQSRKMGGLATRTLDATKQFLKQDVSHLQTTSLRPKTQQRTQQSAMHSLSDIENDRNQSNWQQQSYSDQKSFDESRESMTLDPRDKLQSIVQKSHQVLAGARSVMLPVNLFPDSVIVDRTKVTITKRDFFWTANVISIRIEDVLNVASNTGPFFGSLTISSRVMNSTDHYEISYFWRKDAIYLKQLIQGYVIAQHNRIETSHLGRDELVQTLLELGQDSDF